MTLIDYLDMNITDVATPGFVTFVALAVGAWVLSVVAIIWFIHKTGWHNDPALREYSDQEQMKALTRYERDKAAKAAIKNSPDPDDWDFKKGTIRDGR